VASCYFVHSGGVYSSMSLVNPSTLIRVDGKRAYRSLGDDPGFVAYFRSASPIDMMSKPNIGSRSAERMAGVFYPPRGSAGQMQISDRVTRDSDALDETMTVNWVLHEHPEAKPAFERLLIDLPFEGCDCLDEVAWRHGLESRELLEQLQRAIDAPAESPAVHAALN